MKERLRDLLAEVGESFDYLRSDVRGLSRYMMELEELLEGYRDFAATVTLSTSAEQAVRRRLLKKTSKVLGPPQTVLDGQEDQTDCLTIGYHAEEERHGEVVKKL